ncbi:GLUG motif-containing protein [Ideonella oryzae]|uniref:Filamentous hemagglutinin N-terminal domain-containing protein n=1 Tax=Ideonella oryzae TaxID=2937441 RepID=A0ABT1BP64_9BURK|nr:GLUG motif-containing protein [Ideonella oryzae]MCO5977734.1 filamentous hemagglutinin N-terminal domain-containing protein [Ideonella oryzae]
MNRPSFHPRRLSLAIAALCCTPALWAAPQGGVVTSGTATIGQSGAVTTIDQASQRAAIDWQSFSVGARETVNFNQPNASAVILNRVIGNERSVIDGALHANGQVFLINSNGVLFGKGSSVSAAGLVASTRDLGNADFEAGRAVFQGDSAGAVVNMGRLSAGTGGYVALLGQQVVNEGVIVATQGTVALASGNRISLHFNGDSLLGLSLDQGALDALVDNRGAVYADGGSVVLTAKAAEALLGSQVNDSGIVQARTLGDLQGDILLNALGGTTRVSGTLDASAPAGGAGGRIETSGRAVQIADGALISTRAAQGATGHWTIDPDGFTVGADGDISATTLSGLLASNNITLESTGGHGTDGDIHVNDAISWAADTVLTLTATQDVAIHAPITATGGHAGLALNYGGDYSIDTGAGASVTLSGANASLSLNGTAYTLVHDMAALAALDDVHGLAAGHYALAEDLDASGTPYSAAVVAYLSGTLAGLGHTISHLTLSEAYGSTDNLGLIGTITSTGTVRDLGLSDVQVDGPLYVGALAGENDGAILNSHSSGTVSGYINVGGLVGTNVGSITQSWSSAAVLGAQADYGSGLEGYYSGVGGLAGENYGSITDAHASGDVTVLSADPSASATYIGGLVGYNGNGVLTRTYASGDVTTTSNVYYVGGLAGISSGSQAAIIDSQASGNVSGGNHVGGLVGSNGYGASIRGSSATGTVTGLSTDSPADVGGLVGENLSGSTISSSFATGEVTGNNSYMGGLVGSNGGSVADSYATGNVDPTGNNNAGGLVGSNAGEISGSHATGNVSGEYVGGLAALNSGSIADSYATGNVTGSYAAGGLVGGNTGTITGSNASGAVDGAYDAAGGLVAVNSGSISDSSATGAVTGATAAGDDKLTGRNTGTITNSSYHDVAAEAAAAAAQAAADAAAQAAADAAAKAAADAAAKAAADAAAAAAAQAAADAAAKAAADAAAAAAAQAAADAAAKAAADAAAKAAADAAAAAAAQAAADAAAAAAAQAAADAAAKAAADAAAQAAAQQAAQQAARQAALAQAALERRIQEGTGQAAQAVADAQRVTRQGAVAANEAISAQPRAAALDSHLIISEPGRFSAHVRRIEVDGQVYELDDSAAAPGTSRPATPP